MFNRWYSTCNKTYFDRMSQYEPQKNENNIFDQLHEDLGLQIETTDKIIFFLKQTGLYGLI